jgi:hypothetical protein
MSDKTQSKIVAVVDHEKGQKHTWNVTKVQDGNHPAHSKGYAEGQTFYTLMEAGKECASHDLYRLQNEASMTDPEFRFLVQTNFVDLEDGETYEVGEPELDAL